MKYDLKAMDFDVNEAWAALRDRTRLERAFLWKQEPEEAASFWRAARDGEVPTSEWHPKVKAMIAQWEAENGVEEEPAAENQSREVRFYIPERTPGKDPAVTVNMSLRDWFAGQALVGMGDSVPWPEGVAPADQSDPRIDIRKPEAQQARAQWAYRQADAMMAERKKGGAS